MGKRKFIFFDVDGTLAAGRPGQQYVPESTKLALKKLRENGHFLAIATGRSHAMALQMMQDLGFHNMVHDGGNGITIDDQLVFIEPLDRKKCIKLINECKENGILWGISPYDTTYRLVPDERFYEFTHDVYMDTKVKEGLDPEDYENIYKVYIACYSPKEERLQTLNELPWCRFHKEYLFVEPANKEKGIKSMVDHLGGDYKDVVVFGDAKNDLSMFCDEWTSIAMGNAIDELKQKADYVTTDVTEDGIYHACKHFEWI